MMLKSVEPTEVIDAFSGLYGVRVCVCVCMYPPWYVYICIYILIYMYIYIYIYIFNVCGTQVVSRKIDEWRNRIISIHELNTLSLCKV